MVKGFNGVSVGRSIGMLFFWVTPATCVGSIFLFAFGVSMLSYFLTGQENIGVWEVLKLMEGLPDPREFITDSMRAYNNISYYASQIPMQRVGNINNANDVLKVLYNGLMTIIKIMINGLAFLLTLVVSIVLFPIYCVFFTFRTCGAFLSVLGVNGVNEYSSLTWNLTGWLFGESGY